MAHGLFEQAEKLLLLSSGGKVLNTAFIERFNATSRERLANLTRKSRHAAARVQTLHAEMYLLGCTYNFCLAHQELSKEKHRGFLCTPDMAAGLTDHLWSFGELLSYHIAPAAWVEPKRRGRPKKQAVSPSKLTSSHRVASRQRALLRLHKGVLCSTTR